MTVKPNGNVPAYELFRPGDQVIVHQLEHADTGYQKITPADRDRIVEAMNGEKGEFDTALFVQSLQRLVDRNTSLSDLAKYVYTTLRQEGVR